MKTIAFNIKYLNVRGTTTVILDYAFYNETILGNKSIIVVDKQGISSEDSLDFSKEKEVLQLLKDQFELIEYTNKDELRRELDRRNCEYIYYIKAGRIDNDFLEGKKNLIHSVYASNQPHGHRYKYVSSWLSEVTNNGIGFVPHIVAMPSNTSYDKENYFTKFNLNCYKDTLIGRYGGCTTFDIEWVQQTIGFLVTIDPTFHFIFANTNKFIDHPNVHFIDTLVSKEEKRTFIESCNAMLHGGSMGETFGLSVCEFLFYDRPTIVPNCGTLGLHHLKLLEGTGWIYNNNIELLQLLYKVKNKEMFPYKSVWKTPSSIVKEFCPGKVMSIFDREFLS